MLIVNEIIEILYCNRLMQSDNEVYTFDETLRHFPTDYVFDREIFRKLLSVFDDDTQHSEVMSGLKGIVETVYSRSPDLYCQYLLSSLDHLLQRATGWASILVFQLVSVPFIGGTFSKQINEISASHLQVIFAFMVQEGILDVDEIESIEEKISWKFNLVV